MNGIHELLKGIYKAPTEKFVMEITAMFSMLKAENTNFKKELEELRREVRSTFMAQNINLTQNVNSTQDPKINPPVTSQQTKKRKLVLTYQRAHQRLEL